MILKTLGNESRTKIAVFQIFEFNYLDFGDET